jgi:ACS family glucarate transporter-like MFS transporter
MIAPSSSLPTPTPPTRVRYRVVGIVILLGMITYIDRACISRMTGPIMADLGLTQVQMGWVFSSFALAYGLFEIPTGCMADRSGARIVFARIVLWWSAFTMATAAAANYGMLLVIRFLFGAGEAGAWPCMARTFSRWVPRGERDAVQGIFFSGAHLGAALTPFLVSWLLGWMSWRMVFVSFGFLGIAWTAIWLFWFRDEPAQHPAVNAAERELIETGREPLRNHEFNSSYWRRLATNRNVLVLCLMYIPNSTVFYFCITWLPTYLREKHHFDRSAADFYAGLPFFLAVFADLFGGFITNLAVRRFGAKGGRMRIGVATYVLAAAALMTVPFCPNPHIAAVLIALAVAVTMVSLAGAWSNCIEAAGSQPAVVGATMNSAGNFAAMLCPLLVSYSREWFDSWNPPLFIIGGLFLVGAVCWCLIDPEKKVFND